MSVTPAVIQIRVLRERQSSQQLLQGLWVRRIGDAQLGFALLD